MPVSDSRSEIFTKLFAETRDALHRYIRRFVGSSETAKEIVQEAFLRTYREQESVTTLRAFLFSTARNLAANDYRHRRTVERNAFSICSGGIEVRKAMNPPLPFISLGEANAPAIASACSTGP